MKAPTLLCIFLVLLLEVLAKNLESRPKAVNESTSSSASVLILSKSKTSPEPSQRNKKRYAIKEVILYLTPSQIEALQAGKGLVSPQSVPELESREELSSQDQKLQEQTEFVKQEFENIKSAIIQPNEENIELASQKPSLQREILPIENQQEFNDQWRQEQSNQDGLLKLLDSYIELKKAEQLDSQQEVKYNSGSNAWLKYSPNIQISEGYSVQEPQQDEIVGSDQFQLNGLSSLPSAKILTQTAKPLLQLQYSPKYNDQKKAIEIEKILRTRHRYELSKPSALIQEEKIANSPAILVDDQLKITKQNQASIVNDVKVPVSIPILVSVPDSVPVKEPYPYRVVEEIPVPIRQRDSLLNKPLTYDIERQISVPLTKTVFLNVDST